MTDFLQITNTNPMVFCHELQDAIQDGYVIDENMEFSMFYNLYTIGMIREDKPAKGVGRPKQGK